MVGPGEVDEDLEPEVKDECNTKYGDVVKVVIYEIPNNPADEAVRIFVEFKRMESAIKGNGYKHNRRQCFPVNKFLSYCLLLFFPHSCC